MPATIAVFLRVSLPSFVAQIRMRPTRKAIRPARERLTRSASVAIANTDHIKIFHLLLGSRRLPEIRVIAQTLMKEARKLGLINVDPTLSNPSLERML